MSFTIYDVEQYIYITSLLDDVLYKRDTYYSFHGLKVDKYKDIVEHFQKQIELYSSSYKKNKNDERTMKTEKILKYYTLMNVDNNYFSDGVKRIKNPFLKTLFSFILNKLT